nr:hypothetical protein [Tanacetum cinerariifolium]
MSTLNQQTLANSGANERPSMLENGNYIPWESRFRRFLDNKLEEGDRMWRSIEKGPYKRLMIANLDNTTAQILEPLSKMTDGNKKQYIADVKVMNYFLQAIPNDIYNSVDACKNAKDMRERIKRLMFGSDVTNHVRHSRLMDEFDKFAAYEGESLEYVHERLTTLVNIMDRNDVLPIQVSMNTKFLNCLQPEWSKYVTMVMVTEIQGHKPEIKHLMQEIEIMTEIRLYSVFHELSQLREREQMLLAMKDEAGSNLKDEENNFMLDNSYGDETLEELISTLIMMARIQTADDNADCEPSYDAKAVSEVYASNKVHEQVNHAKRKTIIHTSADDQIDSNIIFDDPYVENNGGTSEHDSNAHDEYHNIQMLAYNVQREAENKKQLNNELKKQKEFLQKVLETFKDRVKTFTSKTIQCSKYKETCEELEREIRSDKDTIEKILKEKDKIKSDFFKVENEKLIIQHETQLAKKDFKERKNRYLDDIVDFEEKLSSHDRIVYIMGQSIQTIHMLGK